MKSDTVIILAAVGLVAYLVWSRSAASAASPLSATSLAGQAAQKALGGSSSPAGSGGGSSAGGGGGPLAWSGSEVETEPPVTAQELPAGDPDPSTWDTSGAVVATGDVASGGSILDTSDEDDAYDESTGDMADY